MDANQTLRDFRQALDDQDRDSVKTYGEALVRWALNGGSLPDGFASAGGLCRDLDAIMAPVVWGWGPKRHSVGPARNSA